MVYMLRQVIGKAAFVGMFIVACGPFFSVWAGQYSTFDKDLDGWALWGEGLGRHVPDLGHNGNGSLALMCNSGETITIHKNLRMQPGRYKVTAWLRALDVAKGEWNYSIWLFYQSGSEIQSPMKDLHGTFEWSKITYTIDAGERPVDIWFRLKSQGMLWVDDIAIEAYDGDSIAWQMDKNSAAFPKPNRIGEGLRCPFCYRWMPEERKNCSVCGTTLLDEKDAQEQGNQKPPVKILMDFERPKRKVEAHRHYLSQFSDRIATSGSSSAIIKFAQYNNLRMEDKEMRDWSGYDYLEMDVYNPFHENIPFALVIGDQEGGGYWNQLNHHSQLSFGWNHLSFHVNRYVGERGSIQIKRYLDLSHIKKAWFAVAPEDTRKKEGDFYIDNIRLTQAPKLKVGFPELYAFDFVKESFHTENGFVGIEPRHTYSKDIGFGLVNAKVWRTHDSLYADNLHRDGIFINNGGFRIDVPNGRYILRLVPYALGEWNEHFWTKRRIAIQGKTVLNEQRNTANHYLKDYLRFQNMEPRPGDSAFDLYLSKIFREIVTEVNVENGHIQIDCEGDDSGIMLNSLVIYPLMKKERGEEFIKSVRAMQKDEFDKLCRLLTPEPMIEEGAIAEEDIKKGFYTALITSDNQLRYNQVFKSLGSSIALQGGRLERPVQALMLRNLTHDVSRFKITSSILKNKNGQTIQPRPDWLRYGVNQYQSHSFNHETYELAPRFFRQIQPDGLEVGHDFSVLIWYQIPLDEAIEAGDYSGTLDISRGDQQVTYPVTLQVYDYSLPPADIAVGFFGLDPVGFDYFNGEGINALKRKNRSQVLHSLHERGFTTWTSLPFNQFAKSGAEWQLNTDEVDALMVEAKQLGFLQKVFTYGGTWPVNLDLEGAIDGVPQSIYYQKTAQVLQQRSAKEGWLPIVFDISDEATGYSQMVDRDLRRAKILEENFPFLLRGGFSHPIDDGKYGAELNKHFTDISLSSQTDKFASWLEKNHRKWGYYNQSIGLFENDRWAFGRSLHHARKTGCDHLLGWHLTGVQNYPYYDLDGRENDAMMLFPRQDGAFDYALKFEWAAQGVEDYRLLLLLEKRLEQAAEKGESARQWLKSLGHNDGQAVANGTLRKSSGSMPVLDADQFRQQLHAMILSL